MIIEELTKLGLSEEESQIYLTCLENNGLSVVDIAKITGIARTTLYTPINSLLKIKLLSYVVHRKRKLLRAAPLKMLEELVNEELAISNQRKSLVGPLIKSLEKRAKNAADGSVEIVEGENGIKYLISLILSSKKDFYWIGSFETVLAAIKEKALFKLLTWKRLDGKTTSYAISDNTLIKYPKFSDYIQSFRKIKILEEKIVLPGLIVAFAGIIAFTDISQKGKAKIFIIHDEQSTEFYKFVFFELWKKL